MAWFFAVMVVGWMMLSSISFGYSGGDGSAGDPYQIADVNDLLELSANTGNYNKCFILTADIDLAGHTFTAAVVSPQTTTNNVFNGTQFSGHFDGNGHIIFNLTINTTNGSFIGLFGCTGSGSQVSNLGLEGVEIIGYEAVGSLCGLNNSTITSCYATGVVAGSSYVGGLCGGNKGNISQSFTSETVTGDSTIGSLCGWNQGNLSQCYTTGNVIGSTSYVGGLCGRNDSGTISQCYAIGDVTESGSYVGGLCGDNHATIIFCYAAGRVAGDDYVGGLCGRNYNGILNQCYAIGAVTGSTYVGGLCGYQIGTSAQLLNSFWDTETSGQTVGYNLQYGNLGTITNVAGKTTAEMMTESTFTVVGWDFSNADGDAAEWFLPEDQYPQQICWIMAAVSDTIGMMQQDAKAALVSANFQIKTVYTISDTIPFDLVIDQSPAAGIEIPCGSTITLTVSWGAKYAGSGTEAYPYLITTKRELLILATSFADYGSYFNLTTDIDLSEEMFTEAVIAPNSNVPFNGTFDGNGHIISNLNINTTSNYYVGLFGQVGSGGKIINLGIENTNITGYQYVGGLCGYNYGNITSCYATGTIIGSSLCIPVCGQGDQCANCLGVLCGLNRGTISQSYASGTVVGVNAVGGLCGCNPGSINQCYATSIVTGSGSYAGGLCGYSNGGTITASFWDTQTSGTADGVGNVNPDPAGVTGKTTAEMKALSMFTSAGWDFTNEAVHGTNDYWRMCVDGIGYPWLNWESIDGDFACPEGVSVEDLDYFVGRWLLDNCTSDNNYCGGVDVDSSGAVNLADWAVFAGHWMAGV